MHFPRGSPPSYVHLARRCLDRDPKARPSLTEVHLAVKVGQGGGGREEMGAREEEGMVGALLCMPGRQGRQIRVIPCIR